MARWRRWLIWGCLLLLAGFLVGGRETYSPLYPPGPLTLVPGSLTTPSLVANTAATSGLYWPLADHLGLVFQSVETIRFHATALTLHHTAAIRFFHSTGQMAGGQRAHVTALRVSTMGTASSGETDGNDQVIVGHAGTVLRLEGLYTHVATAFSLAAHIVNVLNNGQGGVANSETLAGTRSLYFVNCQDPDNCAILLAEAGVPVGQLVRIVATDNHASLTFADSGSLHLAGAFTAAFTQTISLIYVRDRNGAGNFYEISRSAN
mgnify:CR=1 FL=1